MKTPIFCMLAIMSLNGESFAEALDAGFSISNLRANRLQDLTQFVPERPESSDLQAQGISVMESDSGDPMIVDRSMVDQGITSAASPYFVILSWDAAPDIAGYTVTRDGVVVAELDADATSFRDSNVVQGQTYRYNVAPVGTAVPELAPDELASASTDIPAGRMWSMQVLVPVEAVHEEPALALQKQATVMARRARVSGTTTVSWITFIPQAKIDAPPAGCDYGRGYQFGGDGHESFDWKSNRYRTAVHAIVNWSSKSVTGNTAIGKTTVYRKSDGKLVATKTASKSGMYAKKMGSGGNYVDVRMVTHASNPFCRVGAIDGAFSMHLTQSGNYSIFSGNHRQMPNHYVYIYHGGKVTDVYKRKYASPLCLVGSITCELANFYGSGSF